VATLVLMVAGRGIAKLLSDGQMVPFTDRSAYRFLAGGFVFGLPFSFFIVTAALVLSALCVRRTAIGLSLEAIGDNERAGRLSGVRVRAFKLAAYGFCGFCAGVAGLLAASDTGQADPSRIGLWMELDAIFAVVVGGTALTGGRFTLAGSVVGALILKTLEFTMYGVGMPSDVAPVPKALVVLAVCLVQSEPFRRQCRTIFGRLTSAASRRA
jgi:simple sugar transport system permease protein